MTFIRGTSSSDLVGWEIDNELLSTYQIQDFLNKINDEVALPLPICRITNGTEYYCCIMWKYGEDHHLRVWFHKDGFSHHWIISDDQKSYDGHSFECLIPHLKILAMASLMSE